MKTYHSVEETAAALGVTRQVVYAMLYSVPRVRLGRIIRLDDDAVEQLRLKIAGRDELRDRAYAIPEREALKTQASEMVASIGCRPVDWTYLVIAETPTPLYKIGRARKLAQRLWGLDRGSPIGVRLVALAAGGDYEELLHARMFEHRVRGEWFSEAAGRELTAAFERRRERECLRCVLERQTCLLGSGGRRSHDAA